jgi:hypothetical protein
MSKDNICGNLETELTVAPNEGAIDTWDKGRYILKLTNKGKGEITVTDLRVTKGVWTPTERTAVERDLENKSVMAVANEESDAEIAVVVKLKDNLVPNVITIQPGEEKVLEVVLHTSIRKVKGEKEKAGNGSLELKFDWDSVERIVCKGSEVKMRPIKVVLKK